VIVYVSDLAASVAFYRDVAGLEHRFTDAGYAEFARLMGDQQFLAGERVSLADLMLIAHLELFPTTPEGAAIMKGSPLLVRQNSRLATNETLSAPTMPVA
jgi:lactoylglutathione lyase